MDGLTVIPDENDGKSESAHFVDLTEIVGSVTCQLEKGGFAEDQHCSVSYRVIQKHSV